MSKEEFAKTLTDNGYNVIYEKGYPEVITNDEISYKSAIKDIKKIAVDNGYNFSFGIKIAKKEAI